MDNYTLWYSYKRTLHRNEKRTFYWSMQQTDKSQKYCVQRKQLDTKGFINMRISDPIYTAFNVGRMNLW